MELIADILLVAGALGAAGYCHVLARRLSRFTDLDNGMGAAVALLSRQVDDLGQILGRAQNSATQGTQTLQDLTHQAEAVASRLELMLAAMHDLPAPNTTRANSARSAGAPPDVEATFVRHHQRTG